MENNDKFIEESHQSELQKASDDYDYYYYQIYLENSILD